MVKIICIKSGDYDEVTHSYPFCVTAVCSKLRMVTNLTVIFQAEEANSNLTVNDN